MRKAYYAIMATVIFLLGVYTVWYYNDLTYVLAFVGGFFVASMLGIGEVFLVPPEET